MSTDWRDGDLYLEVRVQPRASRDQISGYADGRYKIRICAPPVDNAANAYLLKFLAHEFGIAKSRLEVIRGHSSRNKRIIIHQPNKLPDWLQREHTTAN